VCVCVCVCVCVRACVCVCVCTHVCPASLHCNGGCHVHVPDRLRTVRRARLQAPEKVSASHGHCNGLRGQSCLEHAFCGIAKAIGPPRPPPTAEKEHKACPPGRAKSAQLAAALEACFANSGSSRPEVCGNCPEGGGKQCCTVHWKWCTQLAQSRCHSSPTGPMGSVCSSRGILRACAASSLWNRRRQFRASDFPFAGHPRNGGGLGCSGLHAKVSPPSPAAASASRGMTSRSDSSGVGATGRGGAS